MDKKSMIGSISTQLAGINLSAKTGDETDMTLSCVFYDTKWRTGNKKIDYQAAAFADEAQKTLFFWESAKIAGSGVSTGIDSEITYQSGTAQFRQVKGISTSADGTISEYLVDLGSIKKIFRETAIHSGWKFRAVINKEKALPPPVPEITEQPPKPQLKTTIPEMKKFCRYCGNKIGPDFIFCSKCGRRLKYDKL